LQTLRPISFRKRNSATTAGRDSLATPGPNPVATAEHTIGATRLPFAALLFIFAAVFVANGCKNTAAPSPDVWAVVNGKEIKRDEVEKYYRTRISPEGQEPSQEEALSLKLNVIDELINNEILLERAKKLNLEASDGEVEDKFTEFKSPYTEDEFQRQLKERGVTVEDLKNTVRRELSIQKLINREVVSKVAITDQDIADFYNANRPQFNVAEPQYRIAQIVVTPRKEPQIRNRKNDDASNEAEAQRKVKMLVDRLNSGADFSQLAMDYSEDMNSAATGGDLGYVPESALNQSDPALKKLVIGLKPGQVSPPIVLKDSIRILKLVTREAPGLRGLTDPQVQQSIRDTLRNRKEQLLRASYLAVARDDARVTNYLAQQVLESNGKLPAAAKSTVPAKAAAPTIPTTPPQN
jgi:peptidyl-prolyl cis-trans isomerase SurA